MVYRKPTTIMKVTFYKFANGHVQTKTAEKTENLTKAELIKIADLRHPVLSKKEFFEVLSTDIKGNPKKKFELLSTTRYLIVER
jgi:hypothetical protein